VIGKSIAELEVQLDTIHLLNPFVHWFLTAGMHQLEFHEFSRIIKVARKGEH
jgi:hypothetical protein